MPVFPLTSPDTGVVELTAKAVGRLALTSGTFMTEYVDDLVKRSFEWLQQDRHEGRRLVAVGIRKDARRNSAEDYSLLLSVL